MNIECNTIFDVPVILRREIEALMIKPFLDAFEQELGHDKTYEIAARVIASIAKEQGAIYAKELGGNDEAALMKQCESWSAGDALAWDLERPCENTLSMNIRKCEYTDLYERLGMKDLGSLLSCMRDDFFYQGFNSQMKMERTKTLMNGDDCCNFCFTFPKKK